MWPLKVLPSTSSEERAGIYFADNVYNSQVTINPSTLAGTPNSENGVYFDDEVEVFSSVEITGNKIDGFDNGIYLSTGVYTSSSLDILDNDINDFTNNGIYIYELYADVDNVIDGNTLTEQNSRGLIRKLEQAEEKLAQGKVSSAIGKLQGFIGQVNGFINAGKIRGEDGEMLIGAAQAIIDELGG